MAVASRPKVVPVLSKPAAAARSTPTRTAKRPLRDDRHLGIIDPTTPQFPNWLILLMVFRKISTPVLLLLVLGVLPLYAWRVNTQHSWGNQYLELEQLRRDERSWLTRTEERKHEISENLEKNPAGFVPKGSKTTLFLKPDPIRAPQAAPKPQADINPIDVAPIGY